MRNISFSLTTPQFQDGSKSVTRRLGWKDLKPGARLMAVEKGMGLKKGETVKRLGEIEVVAVTRERLDAMDTHGPDEPAREGFPAMTCADFVAMFCRHMRCRPQTTVTRIAFKRVNSPQPGAKTAAPRETLFAGVG